MEEIIIEGSDTPLTGRPVGGGQRAVLVDEGDVIGVYQRCDVRPDGRDVYRRVGSEPKPVR